MALPRKILIVEDNALNREMLAAMLEEHYQTLEAENGLEALELLRRSREEVALILLDVVMPVMDGYTFLDELKKDPALALIPVIIMTQGDSEEDEVAALAHGANDFIPKPYRMQVILHRISNIIQMRESAAMVNQFRYDRLTRLYKNEYLYYLMQELLQQDPEGDYDILLSNIENFQVFNDLFGRAEGDRLLCEIANLYRDQIGGKGVYGRISGDYFACLIRRPAAYTEAFFEGAIDRLRRQTRIASTVTLRWGVYEVRDRTVPVEQMCDHALLAAHSVRGQYKCSFAFYDAALRHRMLREQAILDAMEAALAEEQFAVYFQPKYSLQDGSLAGAEALVRWNHPELGFISPGDFVPLFERNGFISRLDNYVWEHTAAKLLEWERRGYPRRPVSVNVSRADIYRLDLVETLENLVRRYGLEPAQLHLEITESAYTETPAQIIATVEQLHERGFVIEMDDFGSGYSSLNMLGQMRLDILKLDMKFIQGEAAKPDDRSILPFVVGLARWLNLRVVAEGIETREQARRLREIGCDYAQGYYFARPLPCAEYERLLAAEAEKERGQTVAMEKE